MLFTITGLVYSCDNEDFTGDSDLTPTNPTVTIEFDSAVFTRSFIEQDSTVTFTVTLSTTQVVDVAVYVIVTGGNATPGEDFTFTDRLVIPAYRTSASGEIKISADELTEETETFTIQVGDERTANASITPQTISFELMNEASDDLDLHLSWDVSDVFNPDGSLISPTAMADLIFYVLESDGTTFDSADGASFEDLTLDASAPDGDYTIAVGVYAFDSPIEATIDLFFDATQTGVQSASVSYAGALTTTNCLSDIVYLATITKVGSTYTITEDLDTDFEADFFVDPANAAIFTGDYQMTQLSGDDPFGAQAFEDQIVTLTGTGNTRSFDAVYLEALGIGQPAMTVSFQFSCGSIVVPVSESTGLGCATGQVITLGPADAQGSFDLSDDSSFTVIFNDFHTDGGCGASPSPVEIEFVKQ